MEARAHAHLGNHSKAARALDACVDAWQEAEGEVAPDWLHYMNQAEVDCLVANTCIELALRTENGRHATAYAERAEQQVLNARVNRTDGYDRSRILDEIRLAQVRLAQRDVAEAAIVAQAALELAAPTSSTVVRNWLLRFHGELTRHYPNNPHVTPFSVPAGRSPSSSYWCDGRGGDNTLLSRSMRDCSILDTKKKQP